MCFMGRIYIFFFSTRDAFFNWEEAMPHIRSSSFDETVTSSEFNSNIFPNKKGTLDAIVGTPKCDCQGTHTHPTNFDHWVYPPVIQHGWKLQPKSRWFSQPETSRKTSRISQPCWMSKSTQADSWTGHQDGIGLRFIHFGVLQQTVHLGCAVSILRVRRWALLTVEHHCCMFFFFFHRDDVASGKLT